MEEQQNNKMTWVWGIVIIVIIALVIWFMVGNKGTPKVGEVSTSTATTTEQTNSNLTATSTEGILMKYLSENISKISPQKEVLGGKFQISNLVVTSANTAEISYSDGHIALAARFNFTIVKGVVTITNFVMLTDKL